MSQSLAWGIIGLGNIAHKFALALPHAQSGRLVAVASRDQAKADKFGAEFNVPPESRYADYDAILADKKVEAVYIATPHNLHAQWAIRAADAGKHILCEKPLAVNYPEAMAMIAAARRNDVFLMEAFMYRCTPQTAKLVELLKAKVIGDVRMIQSSFSFQVGFNPKSRLWANNLAGGGIMDVGLYPISFARMVAGVALGLDGPAEPVELNGSGKLAPTGVDEFAVAQLRFPGDIFAQVTGGVGLNMENGAWIFGTAGNLALTRPWGPAREGGKSVITLTRYGEPAPQEIVVETDQWLYGIEADTVAANLERRQAVFPAMSWDDTLNNMRVLDKWRKAVGVVYDFEKPEADRPPLSGRPVRVRPGSRMKYGTIPHLNKQISRLVIGVVAASMNYADVMFDEFFALGGNTFDTAYHYGPKSEGYLGRWIAKRGLREQVVILDKGAHTPNCSPAGVIAEHKVSLERLATDYVDIYMMHRDNLDVPVGEFIDCLNELVKKGSIRAFGGSNWSLERVEAANAYARVKGLQGFSAVSNNFSLAQMIKPVWDGCVAASDPTSRAWFTKNQLALMPWSSQARGFFTDQAGKDKLSNSELVDSWYSDENFRRRDRAIELAGKRKVLPIAIALAYVLCQPFPTFPLIGPHTLDEMRTSWVALDIQLSPEELRWLNLES